MLHPPPRFGKFRWLCHLFIAELLLANIFCIAGHSKHQSAWESNWFLVGSYPLNYCLALRTNCADSNSPKPDEQMARKSMLESQKVIFRLIIEIQSIKRPRQCEKLVLIVQKSISVNFIDWDDNTTNQYIIHFVLLIDTLGIALKRNRKSRKERKKNLVNWNLSVRTAHFVPLHNFYKWMNELRAEKSKIPINIGNRSPRHQYFS